jgi:hypothetical protein
MRRAMALLLVVLAGMAPAGATAKSKPFQGSELIVGRSVKQPAGSKIFSTGLNVAFAPMDLAYKMVGDQAKTKAVDAVCKNSTDPNCRDTAAGWVENAMDALAGIPDSDWQRIEAAASNPGALDQELQQAGVTDAQARADVQRFVDEIPGSPSDKQAALRLARNVATRRGLNILMEPFLGVNLKWIEITALFPFTIRTVDGSTSANMGNITLDLKSGGVWELGAVSLALSGGLSTYLPSGMRDSDDSARADLFQTPKYLHSYLSLAPYLVLGLDVAQWVQFQTHLEFVTMHGVRDDPDESSRQYLKYGAGLVLLPRIFISIVAELNGLSPIRNSDAMNALFVAGGLQFKFWIMRISIAAQAPVWDGRPRDDTMFRGFPVGKLSTFSMHGRLAFTF